MKLLITRVGALGDVVHALHAVAALRRARPHWQIHWVVDPRWAPLLVDAEGRGPVVNEIMPAETKLWKAAPFSRATLQSVLHLRKELRAEHYDLAVDLQGTLRSAVITRAAHAATSGGFQDPREALAARFYSTTYARRGIHVVEQYASLLGAATGADLLLDLQCGAAPLPHTAWADAWAAEEVSSSAKPLALLSAGGGWAGKLWPAAHFGTLARLLRERGFDVAVNAARADDTHASAVVAASGGAARAVVCNVAGLIALLRRTRLCVGADTGPLHLAAALGVPCVGLYGPTDPARNGPWGGGPSRVLRDPAAVTSYRHTRCLAQPCRT